MSRRRPIDFLSLSFVDLLTITIGGLGAIIALSAISILQTSEPLKKLEVLTDGPLEVSLNSDWNHQLAAIGGLEPYLWSINKESSCKTKKQEPDGRIALPPGIEITRDGKLTGKVKEQSKPAASYCVPIKVTSLGKNDEEIERYRKRLISSGSATIENVDQQLNNKFKIRSKDIRIIITPPEHHIIEKPVPIFLPDAEVNKNYTTKLLDQGETSTNFARLIKINFGKETVNKEFTYKSGQLSGKPTRIGQYMFEFASNDPYLMYRQDKKVFKTVKYKLNVQEPRHFTGPLKITTKGLGTGRFGERYDYQMSLTGGVPPYSWSAKGLPKGLNIEKSTGLIYGNVTIPNNWETQLKNWGEKVKGTLKSAKVDTLITVRDSQGDTVKDKPFEIFIYPRVTEVKGLKIITGQYDLDDYKLGEHVMFNFTAVGGVEPYTWSSSNLPNGFKILGTGRMYGTANEVGTFNIKVTVQDKDAIETDEKDFKLTIKPKLITIKPIIDPEYKVGLEGEASFNISGGIGKYSVIYEGEKLGIKRQEEKTDGNNFTLKFTPNIPGKHNLRLSVSDEDEKTRPKTENFKINVTKSIVKKDPKVTKPAQGEQRVANGGSSNSSEQGSSSLPGFGSLFSCDPNNDGCILNDTITEDIERKYASISKDRLEIVDISSTSGYFSVTHNGEEWRMYGRGLSSGWSSIRIDLRLKNKDGSVINLNHDYCVYHWSLWRLLLFKAGLFDKPSPSKSCRNNL